MILANVTKPRSIKSENEINQLGLDFFYGRFEHFQNVSNRDYVMKCPSFLSFFASRR